MGYLMPFAARSGTTDLRRILLLALMLAPAVVHGHEAQELLSRIEALTIERDDLLAARQRLEANLEELEQQLAQLQQSRVGLYESEQMATRRTDALQTRLVELERERDQLAEQNEARAVLITTLRKRLEAAPSSRSVAPLDVAELDVSRWVTREPAALYDQPRDGALILLNLQTGVALQGWRPSEGVAVSAGWIGVILPGSGLSGFVRASSLSRGDSAAP